MGNAAVYEWDYSRQMLEIRLMEAVRGSGRRQPCAGRAFSALDFLLKRPLLEAIRPTDPAAPVARPCC